jgi:dTDP-N-acetylfucosamine:lipid II N-acetylfucosaminyltransferase
MNHLRQQAMGNIITALWLGAKAHLGDTTTVWRYRSRIGIKAYSIPAELRLGNPEALEPPPEEVVEQNREVLGREFSYDKILGYCRETVAELTKRR